MMGDSYLPTFDNSKNGEEADCGELGSETESEVDDDEAECLAVMKGVQLKIRMFREYLRWK